MSANMMMLIALIGAHCFFDYAGQGDFMAKAKNPSAPFAGVPWWNVMAAHACIHGAAVALITGVWPLFVAEAVLHFTTDRAKCLNRISYNADQAIHIVSKFVWFAVALAVSQ